MLGALPAALLASLLAASSSGPIRRGDPSRPQVAITFDACATKTHGYGFDRPVLEIVRREQVPVTIFVSGRWVESHPDVMQELAADPLIEFGDHSYDHPHMTKLPAWRIAKQIDLTEEALAKYGKSSVAFRPPFGDVDARLVRVVRRLPAHGMPTVTWDVVSGDPSRRQTVAGMTKTVLRRARPGSIIIFHINGRGWRTAEALPGILHGLRERGLGFVPVSALLAGRMPAGAPAATAAPPEPGAAPDAGAAGPDAGAPPDRPPP
jgi:peptidoglycan/xylan/chitin deacetylase (PgdA/CDA1 family)